MGLFLTYGGSLCTQVFASACDTSVPESSIAPIRLSERYYTYSPSLLQKSLSEGKKVLLYFYAPWCTTCSSLDIEIARDPGIIPSDVFVLRIAYDEPSPLKIKYGITLPHTFVWVADDGAVIKEWVGGEPKTLLQNTR